MNPRSTDYNVDALTTAPSRRFQTFSSTDTGNQLNKLRGAPAIWICCITSDSENGNDLFLGITTFLGNDLRKSRDAAPNGVDFQNKGHYFPRRDL